MSIKVAASFAALAAATPIRRGFEASLEYSNVWGLLFPMVNDTIGPDGIVQLVPGKTFTFKATKNAENMAHLASLRGALAVYLQLDMKGRLIESGLWHTYKINVAGKINKPFDPSEDNGSRMITWTFSPIPMDDADPFRIELVNTIA